MHQNNTFENFLNIVSALTLKPILISDYGMLKKATVYILTQGTKNPFTQLHSHQMERYCV